MDIASTSASARKPDLPGQKPHAFVTLDGLRGIAAIAVAVYHYAFSYGHWGLNHGYLAVDFFFALSGFVLSHAYQERLDRNWSLRAFLSQRILRLYPLYFFTYGLGALFYLGVQQLQHRPVWTGSTIAILLLNLVMLPSLPWFRASFFPFNRPSWSIFHELVVNGIHGSLFRKRTNRFMLGSLFLSATALAAVTLRVHSVSIGESYPVAPFAVTRTLFSYIFGMLLYRVWRSGRFQPKLPRATDSVAAACGAPWPAGRPMGICI